MADEAEKPEKKKVEWDKLITDDVLAGLGGNTTPKGSVSLGRGIPSPTIPPNSESVDMYEQATHGKR